MVQARHILRSLTSEPDPSDARQLHPVPFTESPFISDASLQAGRSAVVILSDDDERPSSLLAMEDAWRDANSGKAELAKVATSDSLLEKPHEADRHAQSERESRRPPEWLVSGIFFDISWTTTFSSLTNNTPITTMNTVLSYAVFFTLSWWLWAAQVVYDSKFYTNDWFHRFMLLAQLGVFGSLSAFTKDFDPFSTHVNPKVSDAVNFQKDQYTRESMLGISGMFSVSRLLLAISYARVLYYARRSSSMKGELRALYINIAVCIASSFLYGLAAIIIKFDLNVASVGARLTLWFIATALEVVSFIWTADAPARVLINHDYVNVMGERVRTLTTIILGEGVNGVASILVMAASAIGFGSYAGGSTATASIIIAFAFLLYFDGWRPSAREARRSKLDFLLHFPLHLALIVLLEALKNTLTTAAFTNTFIEFINRFNNPQGGESIDDANIAAAKHLGIDLKALIAKEQARAVDDWHVADPNLAAAVALNQVVGHILYSILQQYQLVGDVQDEFDTYFNDNTHSRALQDNYATRPDDFTPTKLVLQVLREQLEPALWIPIAGGVFLASMSVLAIVNAWLPKNRYVWASALARLAMALFVALCALAKTNARVWDKITGETAAEYGTNLVPVLPIVVMSAFICQYLLDQLIFYIASRRQEKRVSRGRSQARI
ncbi:hypothetical protein EXIGLDRAFT_834942 [Exidia glandulosa HHB12029]|uniref:Low temperature requirement A n=1 Tax=Exidia glandulosa HHB12029 TaxID=1314781 RepID=A0A165J9E1_EXIGL|nr:hypothetical protein EXIGLDRAFT_834942 [Exidia glandulosa HHB12029]